MKLNRVGLQVPEHRCEQEPIRFGQSCERTSRGLFEFFYLLEIVLVVAHRVVDRVGGRASNARDKSARKNFFHYKIYY